MQTLTPESLLIWGIIAHLVADWLFQTEWMAMNKTNLLGPAAWVHGGIHVLFMLWVFPWYLALLIGLIHMLIDTRVPVLWWMKRIKGMPNPGESRPLFASMDQIFHITVIALVVLIFYY